MMYALRSLLVIILMTFATTASALAPCGDLVVDTAGAIKDPAAIERAAARMIEATGADVRVRVSPDYGSEPNLKAYINGIYDDVCPSWKDSRGEYRPDLVVVWLSMNGDLGILFGDDLKSRLTSRYEAIIDMMITDLRVAASEAAKRVEAESDADPTIVVDQALLTSLEQLTVAIGRVGKTPKASEPTPPRTSAPPSISVEASEPFDFKLLALIIAVFGAAGVALVFGRKAWAVQQENARAENERRVMQQKAVEIFNQIGEVSLTTGDVGRRVVKSIEDATSVSASEQVVAWKSQLSQLEDEVQVLSGRHNSVTVPTTADLSRDQYKAAKDSLDVLLPDYRKAQDSLMALAREVESASTLAANLPGALEALRQNVVVSVGTLLSTRESEGFKVANPETIFRSGEQELTNMQNAIEVRDWQGAAGFLARAKLLFNEAKNSLEGLPALRDEVTEKLAQLRARASSFPANMQTARKAMDHMVETYTADCYKLVSGNGTEAEDLHDELTEGLTATEQLIKDQDWDTADTKLAAVKEMLDDIDELFSTIVDRQKRLDQMTVDMRAELAEAERSIEAAKRYISDQSKYNTRDYQLEVMRLTTEFNRIPKPAAGELQPVVEQFRLATAVDDAADALLASLETKVADDIARADRAKRLVLDIDSRIGEYRSYVKIHRGDITDEVGNALKTAEDDFINLVQLQNIDDQLVKGAALGTLLDSVYASAKKSVAQAEAARKRVREAAEEAEREQREITENAQRQRRDANKRIEAARPRDDEDDEDDDKGDDGPSIGFGGISDLIVKPRAPAPRSDLGGSTKSFISPKPSLGGGIRSFGSGVRALGGGTKKW